MDAKSLLFRMLLKRILKRTALAAVLAWVAFAWATGRIAPGEGLARVYATIAEKAGRKKAVASVATAGHSEEAAARAAATAKAAGVDADPKAGAKSAYGANDILCLAHAIYYEARSEPRETQVGVGQVALNRAGAMPGKKSICRIVYLGLGRPMGCLFTQTCRNLGTIPDDEVKWKAAVDLANEMVAGKVEQRLYANATHFNASALRPSWVSGVHKIARAGRFTFYSSTKPVAVEGNEVTEGVAPGKSPAQPKSTGTSAPDDSGAAAERRKAPPPRVAAPARGEAPAPAARGDRKDPPRSPFGDTFN